MYAKWNPRIFQQSPSWLHVACAIGPISLLLCHLQGKEGVSIPQATDAATTHHIWDCQHRSEIQSLAVNETAEGALIGSIDACGRAKLTRVTHSTVQQGDFESQTDSLQQEVGSRCALEEWTCMLIGSWAAEVLVMYLTS